MTWTLNIAIKKAKFNQLDSDKLSENFSDQKTKANADGAKKKLNMTKEKV